MAPADWTTEDDKCLHGSSRVFPCPAEQLRFQHDMSGALWLRFHWKCNHLFHGLTSRGDAGKTTSSRVSLMAFCVDTGLFGAAGILMTWLGILLT